MHRIMVKSKVHRATVTTVGLRGVGGLALSPELLRAADLLPGERVDVVAINNGARLSTYVAPADVDSGVVGFGGGEARLVAAGDLIIVIGYGTYLEGEAISDPRVVFVDSHNRITGTGDDPADSVPGLDTIRGDRVAVR
jgi:aspartate 1-decarboxylase